MTRLPYPIDTAAIRADYPIAAVVARHGIALRPIGRALVGRCPFHRDRGRPNLHVYADTASWYCYRCGAGGDVIDFVRRLAGLSFRDAVAHLTGALPPLPRASAPPPLPETSPEGQRPPDERACLAAAVEVYERRLLGDPSALAYVAARGIDRGTLAAHRVGYAGGDELAAALLGRGLSPAAAARAGLLSAGGRERFAGRIVVPELREEGPIWLVGRAVAANDAAPRYLGLSGRKPLLGWESARDERAVYLTEGPFDWLALRSWGLPALALVGTHARRETLAALARFPRVYLALDGDAAGREATDALRGLLGARAVPVALPGVKDVADLALRPDGRDAFRRAAAEATRAA